MIVVGRLMSLEVIDLHLIVRKRTAKEERRKKKKAISGENIRWCNGETGNSSPARASKSITYRFIVPQNLIRLNACLNSGIFDPAHALDTLGEVAAERRVDRRIIDCDQGLNQPRVSQRQGHRRFGSPERYIALVNLYWCG